MWVTRAAVPLSEATHARRAARAPEAAFSTDGVSRYPRRGCRADRAAIGPRIEHQIVQPAAAAAKGDKNERIRSPGVSAHAASSNAGANQNELRRLYQSVRVPRYRIRTGAPIRPPAITFPAFRGCAGCGHPRGLAKPCASRGQRTRALGADRRYHRSQFPGHGSRCFQKCGPAIPTQQSRGSIRRNIQRDGSPCMLRP